MGQGRAALSVSKVWTVVQVSALWWGISDLQDMVQDARDKLDLAYDALEGDDFIKVNEILNEVEELVDDVNGAVKKILEESR